MVASFATIRNLIFVLTTIVSTVPALSNDSCLSTTDRVAAVTRLEQSYCLGTEGFPIKVNQHKYKVSGGVVAYACNFGNSVVYCKSGDIDTAVVANSGCTRSEEYFDAYLLVGWGPINETFCDGSLARCDTPGEDGCQ